MSIVATEAEPCIVDHAVSKCASPAQSQRLRVDAVLGCEIAASYSAVPGPRGILTAEMAITVASEKTIVLVKVVIDSAVE